MNITLLNTPSINYRNNYLKNSHNSNTVMPSTLTGLKADTVTFTSRYHQKSVHTIGDALEAQMEANFPRLQRIATTFLDVLESVAFKLKDHGFSFDRAYCELSPVKSPKASKSKVIRSSSFKVPDQIRATMYCDDPYDLDKLNLLLSEMKKRGYVLANTDMSIKDLMKRGYIPNPKEAKNLDATKLVPDLDIRLDDEVSEHITKLPPELRYSLGKPQKSGYEDIQMRFVRDFDTKKNPVQHELIVLFGPNYSLAKHNESSDVYSSLRLFDELHMPTPKDKDGSNAHKAERYMDLIKQMFRGKISEKLFLNAKNKDLYDIQDEIPITFTERDISLFENYFNGLRARLHSAYADAKKEATVPSIKRQFTKDYKEDKEKLDTIQTSLRAAIEKYNYQSDLK